MNDILTVRDLSVHFRQGKRLVQLVDRVSFSVARGECLGILGESGSGKSMTCKALLGLLDLNISGVMALLADFLPALRAGPC